LLATVRDSFLATVRDPLLATVRDALLATVRDSLLATFRDSLQATVRDSFPLALCFQFQLLCLNAEKLIGFTSKLLKFHLVVKEGKAVPLQAWSGLEGSRKLRFPDFMTTARDGGRLSALHTGRLYP